MGTFFQLCLSYVELPVSQSLLTNFLFVTSLSSANCEGGLVDFASDDGSRELLGIAQEMEETFVTYDASGNLISPAHRFLVDGPCASVTFVAPDCVGNCTSCTGSKLTRAQCKGRQLKCKGSSIQGLSFPFMSDPMKVIGLFSGGDIE